MINLSLRVLAGPTIWWSFLYVQILNCVLVILPRDALRSHLLICRKDPVGTKHNLKAIVACLNNGTTTDAKEVT